MNRSTVQINVPGDGCYSLIFDIDRTPEAFGPWPYAYLHNHFPCQEPKESIRAELHALAWQRLYQGGMQSEPDDEDYGD